MSERDPPPAADIVSEGNVQVATGKTIRESIHTEGTLRLGAGVLVDGSASARGGAEVGPAARIAGSLDVVGTLHWGAGASAGSAIVRGPLVTEGSTVRVRGLTASAGIHPRPAPGVSP